MATVSVKGLIVHTSSYCVSFYDWGGVSITSRRVA